MLLVILVIGLLLMLLHDIGALTLTHDQSVILTVICLSIAVVGAAGYARDRWSR